MKYYKLSYSIDEKEVGIFPQSINYKNLSPIQEFGLGFYERIDKEFILPELIIRKSAILTNLLCTVIDSSIFAVIDDNFLNFLIKFNINDYQTWELKAEYRGKIIDKYKLFHLSSPCLEIINFEKTLFKVKDINSNILKEKKYQNRKEYQDHWKKLIWEGSVITFDILHLDFSNLDLDIIRIIDIDSIGIGYYVSEKLKTAIEKEKFTGFSFQEIEEMDDRIKVIY